MAWTVRRRIKVIPGIHFNLSRSGISTSLGVRGGSVTLGKNGTYLHTGIPGTGLYNRQKLPTGNNRSKLDRHFPEDNFSSEVEISSADVREITTKSMEDVKNSIILARKQRNEISNDIEVISKALKWSKFQLFLSFILLYGLIKKVVPEKIKQKISLQEKARIELKEELERCYIDLGIDLDEEFDLKYRKLLEEFKILCSSDKIWDVTTQIIPNTRKTRSSAGALVKKVEVHLGLGKLPDIKSKFEAFYFKNANGADIYIYPTFVIIYSSDKKFAVVGLEEFDLHQESIRFVETNSIPKDAEIIDHTWAKVNKNGSPDRRFKTNYQIPVVRYGQMKFLTDSGLNEEYHFSNYRASSQFSKAFEEYKELIKSSGRS